MATTTFTQGTVIASTWLNDVNNLVYSGTPGGGTAATGAGQLLRSTAASAFAWSTATYPGTTTINQILYSSAANTVTGLATANSSVLVTSAAGVPSLSTSLPAGTTLNGSTILTGSGGVLALSGGGTNKALTASNGGIVYTDADSMEVLTATATANQLLMSGSSAAPAWSTATYPATSGTSGTILRSNGTNIVNTTSTFADTYTASNLLYSNGANTVTGLATANNGVLITSGAGVPSISSTIPSATQDNITRTGTITSGVWTGTTIAIANGGTGVTSSDPVIQRVSTQTGAVASGTTRIPFDDTIPQNTEGDQYMTLAITPKNTANILKIEVAIFLADSAAANNLSAALFQDTTAGALACTSCYSIGGAANNLSFVHTMSAGTTSATTFKIRAGGSLAGTTTFNGAAGARLFGGVLASSIVITESAT